MTTQAPTARSILIAALGGEGGGVLAEWITALIRSAGFLVQATSIPGVAQRTGATTYYIEYCPVPAAELGDRRPVFALTPVPGQVDVMLASELMEAARAVQNGYVTPDRTTLIASAHRIYATTEKIAMEDGRFDAGRALKVLHDLSQRAIVFDMERASEQAGTVINAVLFGALAGSNMLGLDRTLFEAVIKGSGRAVGPNLKGFELGFSAARDGFAPPAEGVAASTLPAPRHGALGVAARFPIETQFVVESGYARCLDFQDARYAADYLAKVAALLAQDKALGGSSRGWRLTREGARFLALRMTFEDVMRVADLKSRPSRFAAVRAETRAKDGEPLHITDYLKPGPEELCAMLPPAWAERVLRYVRAHGGAHRYHVGIHLRSHTITGYLMLRLLARLRILRRRSSRFEQESRLTERWWQAVGKAAAIDYAFAIEVAHCADLVKGYGSTYRRGVENFERVFGVVVEPAIARGQNAEAETLGARQAALANPDGDDLVRYLEARVLPPPQRERLSA